MEFAENYDHPLRSVELRETGISEKMESKIEENFQKKRAFFEKEKVLAFFVDNNIQIKNLDIMDDIQKLWIYEFEKQVKEGEKDIDFGCLFFNFFFQKESLSNFFLNFIVQ